MSGAVGQILAKTRVTIEVDGVPFVVRRITAPIAIKVLGSKAFGLVRGAMQDAKKEVSQEDEIALVRKYLAECMVSPRIGDESSDADDTVAFDDMGNMVFDLFNQLLEVSGWKEQVSDFQPPSGEPTG